MVTSSKAGGAINPQCIAASIEHFRIMYTPELTYTNPTVGCICRQSGGTAPMINEPKHLTKRTELNQQATLFLVSDTRSETPR